MNHYLDSLIILLKLQKEKTGSSIMISALKYQFMLLRLSWRI